MDGVDILLPFSSAGLPATSNVDTAADIREHLVGNVNLFLEAARAGVKKIVFPSSGGAVYGNVTGLPASEGDRTDPISSYGITKLASEKYLGLFRHLYGIEYVVLRYANPYGSGQDHTRHFGAVGVFLNALADGRPIEIWGDGNIVRDFVYIDDAVDATLRAINYRGHRRVFNVGSGVGTTLLELVSIAEAVSCKQATVVHYPSRQSDVMKIILDIREAKKELGWTPRTSLMEGVVKTWDSLRSSAPYLPIGSSTPVPSHHVTTPLRV